MIWPTFIRVAPSVKCSPRFGRLRNTCNRCLMLLGRSRFSWSGIIKSRLRLIQVRCRLLVDDCGLWMNVMTMPDGCGLWWCWNRCWWFGSLRWWFFGYVGVQPIVLLLLDGPVDRGCWWLDRQLCCLVLCCLILRWQLQVKFVRTDLLQLRMPEVLVELQCYQNFS